MSESKHVNGPWRYSAMMRPPIGKYDGDVDANGNVFWGYSISGCDENGAPILPTLAAVHNFPDRVEANARLIAAAPELLEALEAIERDASNVTRIHGPRALPAPPSPKPPPPRQRRGEMDNLALYAAFKAHTAGNDIFTRRMAINMADFFGVSPRYVVQQLERLWILKEGSWDWFAANGGITREHVLEVRATLPSTHPKMRRHERDQT